MFLNTYPQCLSRPPVHRTARVSRPPNLKQLRFRGKLLKLFEPVKYKSPSNPVLRESDSVNLD